MLGKIKNFAVIFTTLLLFSSFVLAQENSLESWGIPESPKTCANSEQYLHDVSRMLANQSNPNAVLILVARLGKDENQRELNHRRMHNISEYMKEAYGIKAEKIVAAQGEKTSDFGRIEFYLAGQMVGALLVNRNKDFYVDCYGYGEQYYPQKDEAERKKKIKKKRRG